MSSNRPATLHGKTDLTVGAIRAHLVRLTLPMMTGLFALISFQLVNTYYVSRLGTDPLAAISFTFPVTYIIFSLFLGFSIAVSSVVSRLIGEGKENDVRRVVTHAVMMVFMMSVGIAGTGIFFHDGLFRLIGADEKSLPLINDYMQIYFPGVFFICLPFLINSSLRAAGDAKTPAIIIVSAALFNAALDPVLIFGLLGVPALGLKGAAISTLVCNVGASLVGLCVLLRRRLIERKISFEYFGNSARRLLVIAIPAGLTSGLPSIVNSVILALLAQHGAAAVASYGVVSRVEAFCFIVMMALASGMGPIIGQNFGAGRMDRVRETIIDAVKFCILWSIFIALVLGTCAHFFAHIFSPDTNVQYFIALYFMTVPFSYATSNIVNGWASAFNAMGKPQYAATILFLKQIIVLIPALYLGHHLAGVTGIFAAIAIVNLISGILAHLWGWKRVKSL
jgi:putative MATE family efflux protein